jgi:hypothetical protein
VPYPPASTLFLAWTFLNLLLNVRYPALEPPGLYFLPSIDATVLLAGIALLVWRGYTVPRVAAVVVATAVVVGRALRVADGIVWRYFNRPFDLGLDLPTAGEIPRLLRSTVGLPVLVVGLILMAALAVGFALLTIWSLRAAERSFASPKLRAIFAATAVLTLLISPMVPPGERDVRIGLFGTSVVPRLYREIRGVQRLEERHRAEAARIQAAAARNAALPADLSKLGRNHLLLFFIESYGATVLEHPDHAARIEPVYRSLDAQLAAKGFQVASGLLDSPTYAGRSQLAHQAIATGVRASDRISDTLVQQIRPKTLARIFDQAGYRTLLVMPANIHRNLYRWMYDFQKVYASWDLDYHGPAFGFATMPDQYVVDFIHRREVAVARSPLFVMYALVSSHAPWDVQPPLIQDWSQLGDGRVFAQRPPVRFPINWSNLHQASAAYLHSIAYDLQVLVDYLTRFDLGDALVILLGDHQPVADVTRNSPSQAVPIHIISRQAALIDPFRARGYSASMRPPAMPSPPGMETFLADLLGSLAR